MWSKTNHEVPKLEFENRIERVRSFAIKHDLSGVVVYSAPKIHQWNQTGHVGYLTNWSNLDRIVDAMVVVPVKGKASLLVAGVEYMLDQIEEVSWIGEVRLVSSPDPRSISSSFDASIVGEDTNQGVHSFGAQIREILDATGSGGRPIGISGLEALPVNIYHDLKVNLKDQIAQVPDIVAELRQYKTVQELVLMKRVAAISDSSYQRMLEVLSEGIWGYELTAEMDCVAKRQGADFVYHCMHSAPGNNLKAGKLSVKSHDCQLKRGDYINVNAYVVYK